MAAIPEVVNEVADDLVENLAEWLRDALPGASDAERASGSAYLADRICSHFAGQQVYFPKGVRALAAHRATSARALSANGTSVRDIASCLGVTQMRVRQYLNNG